MVVYYLYSDGNLRGKTQYLAKAKDFESENSLNVFHEVCYSDEGGIITVDGHAFDDFIERISDDKGTEDFIRVKSFFEKEWAK